MLNRITLALIIFKNNENLNQYNKKKYMNKIDIN
jgi:hypothetical protein